MQRSDMPLPPGTNEEAMEEYPLLPIAQDLSGGGQGVCAHPLTKPGGFFLVGSGEEEGGGIVGGKVAFATCSGSETSSCSSSSNNIGDTRGSARGRGGRDDGDTQIGRGFLFQPTAGCTLFLPLVAFQCSDQQG